ncbi:MAG TPA: uridine diphosphate-N-acetylglucosamine-binding protein YvcK, partial [Candidatus Polarisedimenticolaceae bacterium]|nr:uridine diphosphate-N-acetylglucosamine-binding protein YvcK [Candidatus Polarisedimenticolaceae bacterium]
ELTAVVTMTDDGGSSGRLRRSLGVPPPGDVRNCLVALAEEEGLLAAVFQHRYGGSDELGGHSLGNLILAALAEQTGSFVKAVEASSRVLRTAGRILPATQEAVTLEAVLEDGSCVAGETAIASCGKRIRHVALRPRSAPPAPGVIEAIVDADLIVLGPGSLYTSLVPNLVVEAIGEALRETAAPLVLVANIVSERGEAAGLDLRDHIRVIEEHAGGPLVDAVLVHEGPIDALTLDRYREEGAVPLAWPETGGMPQRVLRRNLLAAGPKLRHDPVATAEGVRAAWVDLTSGARAGWQV